MEHITHYFNPYSAGYKTFIFVTVVILYVFYKVYKTYRKPQLPKLRRDFTFEELWNYDIAKPERILLNVNNDIYDVTNYGGFALALYGREASRRKRLTWSMDSSSLEAWFKETHSKRLVGRLLKRGQAHANYADNEEPYEVYFSRLDPR